jgi:uncharacterized protein (TIGR02271 family)
MDVEKLHDFNVLDSEGNRLGTVNHLWVDEATGRLELIGFEGRGLRGTRIVPAPPAEIEEARREIRLPYSQEQVRDAPEMRPERVLGETEENEIFRYYGLERSTMESPTGLPAPAEGERVEGREEVRIPLTEEEMRVGKRTVPTGGVRLRKVVRTERVEEPVELRREEVEIERVPATGAPPPEGAFREGEVFIPTEREEPVVEKTARVTGEVVARKREETERETVAGEVRREEVETERERGREKRRPGPI